MKIIIYFNLLLLLLIYFFIIIIYYYMMMFLSRFRSGRHRFEAGNGRYRDRYQGYRHSRHGHGA